MTTFVEDDTQFAEAIFSPDDGSGRAVGSVNPALQALANRTKFLRAALLPAAVLNLRAAVSTTTQMLRGLYLSGGQTLPLWLAISATPNDLKQSFDGGASWSAFAPAPTIGILLDLASDTAAKPNIVAVGGIGGGVATYSTTTSAWTNVAIESGFQFDNACVTYDPVSALWCVVYRRTSGTLVKAWTSPDRATWTQRTLPAAFAGALPSAVPLSATGGGTTLIANVAASGNVDVAYSTDGGIAWGSANFATFAGATIVRPVYGNGVFMVLAYDPASFRTQVWTSPTGATWTKVQEFATRIRMSALTCVAGKLWVAAGTVGFIRQLAYSFDGVTWRSGVSLGTAQQLVAGPGLMIFDGTTAVPGFALGPAPALAVV